MIAVADPVITLTILGGLAGLEQHTAFRVLSEPDDAVYWLECAGEPAIALPCADALAVLPDYTLELEEGVVDLLDIRHADDVRVLLVVQNWDDPAHILLSTSGPIVWNTRAGLAVG